MSELIPQHDEMGIYQTIAQKATQSKFFDKLGGEGALLCIMLYARELGLPPMQCLYGGMNNIQGKIEIAPRLMQSMIRKAGHRISIIHSDENSCRLKGIRGDDGEAYECEYKIEEAKKAGIFRAGGPWEKYAGDMLFKSCLSRLARRLFADVISTAYIEGEIFEEKKPTKFSKPQPEATEPVNVIIDEAKGIENRVNDFDKISVVENEPTLSESQAYHLSRLVGDDTALRDRIFLAHEKSYGSSVKKFTDIRVKNYNSIVKNLTPSQQQEIAV